jgi:hypothetical protein
MAGTPLDLAWGVACLGAAARWGTIGLGDVAVATRLAGPSVAAGPIVVRSGMLVALVGALVGEARVGAFDVRTWGERGAAVGAMVALVLLFVVRGPGDPRTALPVLWFAFAAAFTVAAMVLRPVVVRLPSWVAPALAGVGVAVSVAAVTR